MGCVRRAVPGPLHRTRGTAQPGLVGGRGRLPGWTAWHQFPWAGFRVVEYGEDRSTPLACCSGGVSSWLRVTWALREISTKWGSETDSKTSGYCPFGLSGVTVPAGPKALKHVCHPFHLWHSNQPPAPSTSGPFPTPSGCAVPTARAFLRNFVLHLDCGPRSCLCHELLPAARSSFSHRSYHSKIQFPSITPCFKSSLAPCCLWGPGSSWGQGPVWLPAHPASLSAFHIPLACGVKYKLFRMPHKVLFRFPCMSHPI